MSTAFYKRSTAPYLVQSFSSPRTHGSAIVQVWNTTCVVTNFGKSILPILKSSVLARKIVYGNDVDCDDIITVLVNPGNPQLSGVRNFPYFPRGGPVPNTSPRSMHKNWQPLGYVSQWGGMEVGEGMLYPVSVVDGLVHQLGGWKLKLECDFTTSIFNDKCPVGTATHTRAGGDDLQRHYDYIVHTSPPFFESINNNTKTNTYDNDPVEDLSKCYQSSIGLATSSTGFAHSTSLIFLCCPLLGAGARGFPYDDAIQVAAKESYNWMTNKRDKSTLEDHDVGEKKIVLAFGIPDLSVAKDLVKEFEKLYV